MKFPKFKHLLFAAVATMACGLAWGKNSRSYVQDGLIAQWDGIDNVLVDGKPAHDPNAEKWIDLTGNGHDFPIAQHLDGQIEGWSDKSLIARHVYKILCDKPCSDFVTMEICVRCKLDRAYSTTSQKSFAIFNAGDDLTKLVATARDGTVQFYNAQPKNYVMDLEKFQAAAVYSPVESSPVVYSNGVLAAQSGSDSWGKNTSTTCLGRGIDTFGSYDFEGEYYAIRLYDRALKPEEIAHNAWLDSVRFLGAMTTDELTVAGEPIEIDGVSPIYGDYEGLVAGETRSFSAPEVVDTDDYRAVCAGYQLYTNAPSNVWLPWGERETATSFTYTHPAGASGKVVWLWSYRDAPKLEGIAARSDATGEFTVSANVTGVGKMEGDTLSVKAIWGTSANFMVYTNDVATVSELGPVELTVDEPTVPGAVHYVSLIGLDKNGEVVFGPSDPVQVRVKTVIGDLPQVPAEYQPLVSVESTDARQFVDTKIEAQVGLSARAKMQFVKRSSDDEAFLSGRCMDPEHHFYLIYHYKGWDVGYDNEHQNGGICEYGVDYDAYATISNGFQQIVANGVVQASKNTTRNPDVKSGVSLYVFAQNSAGSINHPSISRCYWLKIWLNNELVRDYTPCRRLSDGVLGLYDEVDGLFQVNGGGGSLLAGEPLYAPESVLTIDATPSRFGTTAPAYGFYPALEAGTTFECFAPAVYEEGWQKGACTGWIVYTNATDSADTWLKWREGEGNVCLYTHPEGTAAKLVWQWAAAAEAGYENLKVGSDATGRISVSADVTGVGFEPDAQLTFKVRWGRTAAALDHEVELMTATAIGPVSGAFSDLLVPGLEHYVQVVVTDRSGNPVGTAEAPRAVKVLAAGNTDKTVPAEYVPLDYIEANNAGAADQYINTGVPGRGGLVIETKMRWITASGAAFLSARDIDRRRFVYPIYRSGSRWMITYGQDYLGTDIVVGEDYQVKCVVSNGLQRMTANGNVVVESNDPGPYDTGVPLALFARLSADGVTAAPSRCYDLKMWLDDGLVRDFVPCRRIADGMAGLYDRVSGEFFVNQGSGAFVEGEALYGAEETLRIEGAPSRLGNPSPAYGSLGGVPAGTTFECVAPESFTDADSRGQCIGWILYTRQDDGSWIEQDRGDGTVCHYTQPQGAAAKLVWQWSAEHKVALNAAGGTLVLDGQPAAAEQWLTAGAHTLAVTPPAGKAFAYWRGIGVPAAGETAPQLALAVDGPVSLEPVWCAEGACRWLGGTAGNVASELANWADGKMPASGDLVLVGGASTDMTWDLVDVVPGGWLQTPAYVGTVTIPTTFNQTVYPIFTVSGDVEIDGGAWRQQPNPTSESELSVYWLNIAVGGDLRVGPNGSIDANACGFAQQKSVRLDGTTGLYYGSALCPTNYGLSGSWSAGGGALKLTVAKGLTVDGLIAANGGETPKSSSTGSGGSVWITSATLAGSGRIEACGGIRGFAGAGAYGTGGRISLMLTQRGATFPTGLTVSADAALNRISGHPSSVMCGTIYRQTGDEAFGCGEVTVAARPDSFIMDPGYGGSGDKTSIVLPAVFGASANELRRVRLVIGGRSQVKLGADLRVKDFALESSEAYLDLDGHVLDVNSPWRPYPADKAKILNAGEWVDGRKPGYTNIWWQKLGLVIMLQ